MYEITLRIKRAAESILETVTKKKSTSRKSRSSTQNNSTNQTIRLVALVALLLLIGYYLWTGSDPLGLFSLTEQLSDQAPVAPPTVVGSGGDWWQVYFTDPQNVNNPENLRGSVPEKLIEYIDNAQRSIHIASLELDLAPVADALIAAQKRGVEVQWVTDDEHGIEADTAFSFTHDDLGGAMLERAKAGVDVKGILETRGSETQHSALTALYCAGVPVRQDGNRGTFHHKVVIIDDKTVVTGALNFSGNADESNDENVLIVANSDIAAQYLAEFDRRWAEATEVDPKDVKCK